ncbi:MAG: DALR domain-containing protein, partial [Nitrospiria bacterium]
EFEAAMDDDFNTARAIGVLQALRSEINIRLAKGEQIDAVQAKELFQSFGKILGLFRIPLSRWRFSIKVSSTITGSVESLQRVESVPSEEMIQALVEEREEARRKKDWARSDAIRNRLAAAGVVIEDRPNGTTRVKR